MRRMGYVALSESPHKGTFMLRVITLTGLLQLICACSPAQPPAPPLVGGDRDAQGCIGSAGYRWCARTHQCERPWELARQQDFEVGEQAFVTFCDAPADQPELAQ